MADERCEMENQTEWQSANSELNGMKNYNKQHQIFSILLRIIFKLMIIMVSRGARERDQ